jgi:[ribosomal protein S18]-alanine N-acetyltransferase
MARVARRSEVVVRPAHSLDLESVVRIERESFSEPWSHRSFQELLTARQVLFLVAVRDSAVVGYAVVLIAAGEAELANLAVSKSARRNRIGRELLTAALDGVGRLNVSMVYLEVRASNEAAQALYRSLGFQEVARRKQYYRQPLEDALVMKKQKDVG